MSYLDWHVGMKVVCIKSGGWNAVEFDRGNSKPKHGEICTISEMVCDSGGRVFITLVEYDPIDAFLAAHFRPLETRKTDISIFTAILNGARVPEGV